MEARRSDERVRAGAESVQPADLPAGEELQKLAARPDGEIDLSDMPEIREIPSDAVIGRFYRPKKTAVTIRLDVDVLTWLKATGEGYQTRINTYLRHLMQQSRQQ
jgi:uncharacterized protein (DUF4415 family)